jgi:uncharacterized protein (DUF4415 family)
LSLLGIPNFPAASVIGLLQTDNLIKYLHLASVYKCAYNMTRGLPMGSGKGAMKDEYDFSNGRRGAVEPAPPGKTRITIRIDDAILEWFHQEVDAMGGGNYQTLINEALRQYIMQKKEPIEELLRRVVREELSNYRA